MSNADKILSLDADFAAVVGQILTEVSIATSLKWLITSSRRTIAEQDKLFAQGRTAPGKIVTKAKGGQSPHNFGMAVDCVPIKDGDCWWDAPEGFWSTYGAIAKNHGLVWGGDFSGGFTDVPHIELSTWRDTKLLWQQGKIQIS
jgi:peptidoglycan L-alanyl-D-glutamate endopeptidase CwlK